MREDAQNSGECRICGQRLSTDSELCINHELARRKIEEAYTEWKDRLGLNWGEYLTSLNNATGAGLWVRETAQYLAKNNSQ